MHPNEELIHRFYTAFAAGDAVAMTACYHPEATFTDPVFQLSGKKEISDMWSMLCERGSDLTIRYENVQADTASGSADWSAHYTFSATGRKVENHITSLFDLEDGLIIRQCDTFNFYRWCCQALGVPGYLLGWSGFLNKRVRSNARKALKAYQKGR